MSHRLRRILEADLAARLAAGYRDPVLLALHAACGAAALGVTGRIDPVPQAVDAATQARAALASGDRVGALRVCAAAMAGELLDSEVAVLTEVLDEIRRTK